MQAKSMDVAESIKYLRHQRHIVDYLFVCASAVFIYDYFLTLYLEIKLVWLSRWTYTKFLYLLIRYMAFVVAFLTLHNQIFSNVPAEWCRVTYPMVLWLVMLQIFFSEGVLCIRTWAVWFRHKQVGIGLATLTAAHLILQCILVKKVVHALEFASPPFLEFRGCFLIKADNIMWASFAAVAVVESVILILMVISAVSLYRQGLNGELFHVIHIDGVAFYVYLLCLTAANLVVVIALPIDMMVMLSPLEDLLHAMFTTRIILNIREVSDRGSQFELHVSNSESLVFAKSDLTDDGESCQLEDVTT